MFIYFYYYYYLLYLYVYFCVITIYCICIVSDELCMPICCMTMVNTDNNNKWNLLFFKITFLRSSRGLKYSTKRTDRLTFFFQKTQCVQSIDFDWFHISDNFMQYFVGIILKMECIDLVYLSFINSQQIWQFTTKNEHWWHNIYIIFLSITLS